MSNQDELTATQIWSQPKPPDEAVWAVCPYTKAWGGQKMECRRCPEIEKGLGQGHGDGTRGCYAVAQEACRVVHATMCSPALASVEIRNKELTNLLEHLIGAVDDGALEMNSPELTSVTGEPYPWHEEWLAGVRHALSQASGSGEVRASRGEEALRSALLSVAAECHREKWRFSTSDDERNTREQRTRGDAFDTLHRIGDIALKAANSPAEGG